MIKRRTILIKKRDQDCLGGRFIPPPSIKRPLITKMGSLDLLPLEPLTMTKTEAIKTTQKPPVIMMMERGERREETVD